mgnify:CR=1 FL=1
MMSTTHSPWDCIRFCLISHSEETQGFNWVELDGVRFYVGFCKDCEAKASKGIELGQSADPPVAPPKGEASAWATERAMEIAKGRPLLNDCVHATFCIAVHELAEYLDRDESCWKLRAKAYQDEISELKRAHKGGS